MKLSRLAPAGLALLALTIPAAAFAQSSSFTDQDWASLPPYCLVRLRGDEAAKKNLSRQVGEEQFIHLHHYCFGMHFMNKGMTLSDRRKRNEALKQANDEFGYVIQHLPESAPIRAEAMQYKERVKRMIRP